MLEQLKEQGAIFTNLSGSGSTCFGLFPSEEAALKAEKNLAKTWSWVRVAGVLGK